MATSSTNHDQIYIDKTITLAETIIIKSNDTADAQNAYVRDFLGSEPDLLDPSSWRYYMNMAGDYHSSNKPMEVVSLDTLQMIAFTKANLVRHRGTRQGYAYGTRYYRELVKQYPQQEMLILGILYPVDKAAAIAAPDKTILGILPGMIEPNEYSILDEMQTWLYTYDRRWTNPQFAITDNLYVTANLGIMYLTLFQWTITYRKRMCKTKEAHSFHVRQYLLSNGLLDSELNHLTLKQSLWLYRNMEAITHKAGQKETFEWLVENILTEREVPLAEYSMRHDLSGMPANFYPDLKFRRKPLNLGYSVNSLDNINLRTLLDKEDDYARANADVKEDELPAIRELMELSPSNVLMTKVLESTMIDYTDSEFFPLSDILINHWLYLASHDLYVTATQVAIPGSPVRVPMKARDAYSLMWYCFMQTVGVTMEDVPVLVAERVQRIPLPSPEELMSVVDKTLVSKDLAVIALSLNPHIEQIISIEEFNEVCREIFLAANNQRSLYALMEHQDARGYVQGMINRIYTDAICALSPEGETYKQFFARLNIQLKGLEREDYATMWQNIVADVTGANLTTTLSVKQMQKAMLRIMKQLSSYTVQFLSEINDAAITPLDHPGVRIGDTSTHTDDYVELPDTGIRIVDTHVQTRHVIDFDINACRLAGPLYARGLNTFNYEIPNLVSIDDSGMVFNADFDVAAVRVDFVEDPEQNDQGSFPMPGVEFFLAMSPEKRKALMDAFHEKV